MCFWLSSQSQDASASSTSHPSLTLFPDSKSIRDQLPLSSVISSKRTVVWAKTSLSLALSAVGAGAFRSRWTVFHPLFDRDPGLFVGGGGGRRVRAPLLSSCSRRIGAAAEVSAGLLSARHAAADLLLFRVWLHNFPHLSSVPGEGLAADRYIYFCLSNLAVFSPG